MPRTEHYDELLKTTQEMIAVARRMYPKASGKTVKVVCEAAIEMELEETARAA